MVPRRRFEVLQDDRTLYWFLRSNVMEVDVTEGWFDPLRVPTGDEHKSQQHGKPHGEIVLRRHAFASYPDRHRDHERNERRP
jgi:hypothetical protein